MMLTDTLPPFETAMILRVRLGPLRVWPDFLADCIRNKQSVSGLTLLPVGKQLGKTNYSPRYAVSDIDEFIESVKACTPSAGPSKIKPVALDIDGRHWSVNKFDRTGKPVHRKCGIYGAARSGAGNWTTQNRRGGGHSAPYSH